MNEAMEPAFTTKLKRCPECGNHLPATEEYWHKNAARPDGWSSICKQCKKKMDKRLYMQNKYSSDLDKLKARMIKKLEKEYMEKKIKDLVGNDPDFLKEKEAIENAEKVEDLI